MQLTDHRKTSKQNTNLKIRQLKYQAHLAKQLVTIKKKEKKKSNCKNLRLRGLIGEISIVKFM